MTRTLEAALWAFASADDFESGALKAVNLGDDADTTGAVYGQIAGVSNGSSEIPWAEKVALRDAIERLATGLATRSEWLPRGASGHPFRAPLRGPPRAHTPSSQTFMTGRV